MSSTLALSEISIAAVVLAGGQGLRMGNLDKGLVRFEGEPMIYWTLKCVDPSVEKILINCNRNFDLYQNYGYELVQDELAGFQGPLAGIYAAMAKLGAKYTHLLVLPCDTPLIDETLLQRLLSAASNDRLAIHVLQADEQPQFLHAVIPMVYQQNLLKWLSGGERAVYKWYKSLPLKYVDVPAGLNKTLKNINAKHDLA